MGPALKLLLDTSTLIWSVSDPANLTDAARGSLVDDDNVIIVSAATAWEIATKHRLGRLPQAQPLIDDWAGELDRRGFQPLGITDRHALHAGGYDLAHADPFDRIIAAQAELEDMTLVAGDRAFDLFPVRRLW